MDPKPRDVRDVPTLWSIPCTILMIILLLAAADTLFPFIPLNIGQRSWMWAISTLVTTIIAGLIAEMISMDNRRALISMGIAAIVSTVIYIDLSKFLQRSFIDAVQGVIPNPLLGNVVHSLILSVAPGVLTGAVLGGILAFFPGSLNVIRRARMIEPQVSVNNQWTGYEKTCKRCGHPSPFESKFCPFCGVKLLRRQAPPVMFCRFCGVRIYMVGDYCPECGKEIVTLSKPSVYISQ